MMYYVTKVRSAIHLTSSTTSYSMLQEKRIYFVDAYQNDSNSSSSSNTKADADDIMQCGPLPCVLWIAVGIIFLFMCTTSLAALCICHLRRRQRAHMYERVVDDDDEDENNNDEDADNEHVNDRINVHANKNNNNNNNHENRNANNDDNNNNKDQNNMDNLYENTNVKQTNEENNANEGKMVDNLTSSDGIKNTKVVLDGELMSNNNNNNNNAHSHNAKCDKLVKANEIVNEEDNVVCQSNYRNNNTAKNFNCENKTTNTNYTNDDNIIALKEGNKCAPISRIQEEQSKMTKLNEDEYYQQRQQQANHDKMRHGAKLTRNAAAKFNLDSPSQFQSAHVFEAVKPNTTNSLAEHDVNQAEYDMYDDYYAPQALQQQQQHFAEPWQPVVVNRSSVLKKKEMATNAQKTIHNDTKPAHPPAPHHAHKKESRRQLGKEKNAPYLEDDLSVAACTVNGNAHDDKSTLFPQHELSADDLMLKEAEFNTQMENPASFQSIVEFKGSGSFFNPSAQVSG